jgi:hypothetical protein
MIHKRHREFLTIRTNSGSGKAFTIALSLCPPLRASVSNNPAQSPHPSATLISCKEVIQTTATASTRLMKELKTEKRV